MGGERRSTIVRPDGSTFAVTVPAGGMDASDDAEWAHDWIAGDRGPDRPTGLSRLHRAVLADLCDGPFVDAGRSEPTR